MAVFHNKPVRGMGFFSRRSAPEAGKQFEQGRAYALGFGVRKDDAMAVRCWRKAAEQGHVAAQVALGDSYADGRGVEGTYRRRANGIWRLPGKETPKRRPKLA